MNANSDNIIDDLLNNDNYDAIETATFYPGMTHGKMRRMETISEQISELSRAERVDDESLVDDNPIDALQREFNEIVDSLGAVEFKLRPIGPMKLAVIQESYEAAQQAAQTEIDAAQAENRPVDERIILRGLPIALEANLAATCIIDPQITPDQWLAMLEKFGVGLGNVIEVKDRLIGRTAGDVIPKLPTV